MSSQNEHDPKNPALDRLSRREQQVLELVADGKTSKAIGEILNLSPRTVDTYRSRIMVKLQVGHLAGLVKFAIRNGITTL